MDLAQLRYVRAVIREGGISAAARSLGVAQATVSAAIQNLETELGTRLFFRSHAGVRPTATGDALAARIDGLLGLADEIATTVRSLESGETGSFTIGCYESLGAWFLPGFLAEFLPRHPGIELQLWNGSSAAVREAVLDRLVHFGLVVNCAVHDDLVLVPACTDHIEVFALNAGAPGTSLDDVRLRLRRGPLIWCDRPIFRELVTELHGALDATPPSLVCGDLELVKSLALAGIGAAVLPRRVAAYGHDRPLAPLHAALPSRVDHIHLVYRADLHRTRAARIVRDELARHGRALG